MGWTVLEANIRAGLTPAAKQDVSEEVTRFLITETMETVQRRKSFAQTKTITTKGGSNAALGIDFDTDVDDPARFREIARTGFHDDTTTTSGRRPGEIWIEGTEKTGAVSETNPCWGGWALITELDSFGGTPGEVRSQSKTWQLRNLTKRTTPEDSDDLS